MQQQGISEPTQQQLLSEKTNLAKAQLPEHLSADLKHTLRGGIRQSFLNSFQSVMFVSAALVVAASLCSALLIRYKPEDSNEK